MMNQTVKVQVKAVIQISLATIRNFQVRNRKRARR